MEGFGWYYAKRMKWQPTPVFLPGESQGWRTLVGCCLWGHTESDTTEATLQKDESVMGWFNKRRYIKEIEESKKHKITSYTKSIPLKKPLPFYLSNK